MSITHSTLKVMVISTSIMICFSSSVASEGGKKRPRHLEQVHAEGRKMHEKGVRTDGAQSNLKRPNTAQNTINREKRKGAPTPSPSQ